ncbi:MAG: hypothetical protein WEE64_11645 [Dehalococcoidia bacterium]
MTRPQAPSRHRFGRPLLLGALLATVLVAAGCGVDFSPESEESEIFRGLSITGDFRPSGTLSLTLEYQQPYPVLMTVACDLLRDGVGKRDDRLVARIFELPLNVNENGGPVGESEPLLGDLKQDFRAPEQAGRYEVDCFTTAEEDNDIGRIITVAIPTSTPTPEPQGTPTP